MSGSQWYYLLHKEVKSWDSTTWLRYCNFQTPERVKEESTALREDGRPLWSTYISRMSLATWSHSKTERCSCGCISGSSGTVDDVILLRLLQEIAWGWESPKAHRGKCISWLKGLCFADVEQGFLKEGVKIHLTAAMLPLNSPNFFLSSHLQSVDLAIQGYTFTRLYF